MNKEHLKSPWAFASVAIVAVIVGYTVLMNAGVVEAENEDSYMCPVGEHGTHE